jgi:recombinational DNA repair protein (RecF pathway)
MSKYSCIHCHKEIGYGESFSPTEYGIFCDQCYDNLSVTVHRVLVTLESGLTHVSEHRRFNSAWVNAIQFILKSGEEVRETVSYKVQKFEGEKYVQKS